MAMFPTTEWMEAIKEKLNTDQKYAQIAHNWEGDMLVFIEPGSPFQQSAMQVKNIAGVCLASRRTA